MVGFGERVLVAFEERLGIGVFEGLEARATRNGVLAEEEKLEGRGERSGDRLKHFIAFHRLLSSSQFLNISRFFKTLRFEFDHLIKILFQNIQEKNTWKITKNNQRK